MVVLRGFYRLITPTAPTHGGPILELDHVDAEINRALDPYMIYIHAVRSGDRERLAKAPLPEFYTDELLLEALRRTQREPSLYDAFWEHVSQRFLTRLFSKTARTQTAYSGHLEQSAAARNAFLRELSKRPDLRLEYEKIRSTLQADIAEQDLRKAKADRERNTSVEPEPQSKPQSGQKPRSYEEKMAPLNAWRAGRVAYYDANNYAADHPLRKQTDRMYQDLSRRINNGEDVRIPD